MATKTKRRKGAPNLNLRDPGHVLTKQLDRLCVLLRLPDRSSVIRRLAEEKLKSVEQVS